MQTAAVIMTKKVVTVTSETSVAEIANLLLEHKISAVPVIDDEQHILGIISEGDLLGRHPPAAHAAGGCGSSAKTRRAWRRSRLPGI